ncbi:hypothetical protein HDR59_04140 [bacterium]|nr:hypothetical protein [bacterium]
MKKYKDNTLSNYKITTIKEVKKRLKQLEKEDYIILGKETYELDKQLTKELKSSLISNEKNFQSFIYSLAKISVSEEYKYNTLDCLNTIKEIFKENNIDSLSSFIYIHATFIKYKYTDLSIELKKITHIIETHKNNKTFIDKINQYIKKEEFIILLNEELMLETLHSSLIENKIITQEKAEQEKVNNIVSQYYESFKEIRK